MAKTAKTRFRRASVGGIGCSFLFWTSLLAGILLTVNSFLLGAIYPILARFGPRIMADPRLRQAILFVGPVLLLVLQWWLFDRIADWRDARHRGVASDTK